MTQVHTNSNSSRFSQASNWVMPHIPIGTFSRFQIINSVLLYHLIKVFLATTLVCYCHEISTILSPLGSRFPCEEHRPLILTSSFMLVLEVLFGITFASSPIVSPCTQQVILSLQSSRPWNKSRQTTFAVSSGIWQEIYTASRWRPLSSKGQISYMDLTLTWTYKGYQLLQERKARNFIWQMAAKRWTEILKCYENYSRHKSCILDSAWAIQIES